MPLWIIFFLNKIRSYMILQHSFNPHTSGLDAGLAVVAVNQQSFGGE